MMNLLKSQIKRKQDDYVNYGLNGISVINYKVQRRHQTYSEPCYLE